MRAVNRRPAAAAANMDGRRARSVRTRRAIVDAVLALIDDGDLGPSASAIAARAGIAERSIRQHFGSREELFLAALDAHTRRVAPEPGSIDPALPLPERMAAFAELRARDLEACKGIRQAAAFAEQRGGATVPIRRAIDAAWHRRRDELAQVFAPELARARERKALLDELDLLSHGRTWDTLRQALKLSRAEATALLRRTLARALSPSA